MQLGGCRSHGIAVFTICALALAGCASSNRSGNEDAAPATDAGTPDARTGGHFGDPCTTHDECASGYCLPNGGTCTELCDFDCPDGFACQTVQIDGTDYRLCVPAEDTFCNTCRTDEDCGDDLDGCIQLTSGTYCTLGCLADPTICPAGFVCAQVGGSGEGGDWQCRPQNGVCCIDGDGDEHGVGGGCLDADCNEADPDVHNGHPEVCDGKDNDCMNGVDDFPIDCAAALCELGTLGYYERDADVCAGVAGCQQQDAVLCGLYTCSDGGEDGDDCATACEAEADTLCIPDAHCDASVCLDDLDDGLACDEGSDCESGHCQNGFCCAFGDCCQAASDCPGFGTGTPTCDSPDSCQGTRGEAVCNANNVCTTDGTAQDDSACTATTIADDCGFFPAETCSGAASQTAPTCATTCSTNGQCDPDAWCNPSSHVCLGDLPDGSACGTDDGRCQSGHCQNGFCCEDGDCCSVAGDCPGSYTTAPVCTSPTACDGEADVAACQASTCVTIADVDDDAACGPTTVASTCGSYHTVYCSGASTQTAPDCLDSCTSDAECDGNAYCNTGGQCVPDEPNGDACLDDLECQSGHCQNGFCCASGDCCAADNDCNGYDQAATCDSPATCQGSRVEGACSPSFQCGAGSVADDSGCAGIEADGCGPYPATVCTANPSQPPPVCSTTCTNDSQCDVSAHCSPSGMCEPDQGQGGFCTQPQDCGSGLTCVDSVCCNTACNAGCEACDLPGSVGTCTQIGNGQDPDNECGGVGCTGYYYGWSGDNCQRKADVPANVAACNGAGACRTTAQECTAYNVAGPVTTTCHGQCQNPTAGTCTSTIAGACTNVNPGTQSCGTGACVATAPICQNGAPATCTPGTPIGESCNNVDDNCDGTIDNGAFSDAYEPNPDCGTVEVLGSVGSDQSNTYTSMTIYSAGDYDYYALPLHETDSGCGCSFPSFDEDYRLTVRLTVPSGAGSYELCSNINSCGWTAGQCVEIAAGSTGQIVRDIDGGCPGDDNYTAYVRIRGDNAPAFECSPYTLYYFFDAGLCN
jgi:hypothetical protein